jgi:23S rRNA (guanosine2251-2'-O)-methyltransferase
MQLIIGRKPVLEAINSDDDIEQVFLLYGQKGDIINAIIVAAKKKSVKLTQLPFDKFKAVTSNTNAQGVAARKSSQKYYSLENIIRDSKKSEYPLILILDSIQDPRNLGAIIRNAECAGVDGILVTKHNSASLNETVLKASAGATEHSKICLVNNLVNAIKILKDNGFWVMGASLGESKDYSSIDYKIPVAVIIGNEEKGIRRLTADNCDFLIKIPMKGKIQSLNVSVAAGIILFEILRQRNLPRYKS